MKLILSSCFLQMQLSFSRSMFRYCLLVDPIFFALITYMIYKDSSVENFIAYVILGTGLSSLFNNIVFSSAGDIDRERYMGTLEMIFTAPGGFRNIILGKIIGNTLLGLLSMLVVVVFLNIFFGVNMKIASPMFFVMAMLLSVVSFIAISLIMAAIFTLSRNSRGLMNCISYPVMILCGFYFPITILPEWSRVFSYILSPTWAVKLLREAVYGIKDYSSFYMESGILLALSAAYIVLFIILAGVMEKRVRVKATLGVY